MTYKYTGGNNLIINIGNNKEKCKIEFRFSKKKYIADSKNFNSTGHSHMKVKIITEKKVHWKIDFLQISVLYINVIPLRRIVRNRQMKVHEMTDL